MTAQGKRVLVIGGETAVGRALAVGLAEAGADVAIASLSKDTKAEFAVNSALNELWAIGRRGVALAIDASDAAQVRGAVARADALGEPLVVLLGHPGYYPRFGFERASALGLEPPSPHVPDAAFMALRLSQYDARWRGRIVYPPFYEATGTV